MKFSRLALDRDRFSAAGSDNHGPWRCWRWSMNPRRWGGVRLRSGVDHVW